MFEAMQRSQCSASYQAVQLKRQVWERHVGLNARRNLYLSKIASMEMHATYILQGTSPQSSTSCCLEAESQCMESIGRGESNQTFERSVSTEMRLKSITISYLRLLCMRHVSVLQK